MFIGVVRLVDKADTGNTFMIDATMMRAHKSYHAARSVQRSDEGAKCGKCCADEYSTTALFILFGCLRWCQNSVSVVILRTRYFYTYLKSYSSCRAAV